MSDTPDPIAQLDQAKAYLVTTAEMQGNYFAALIFNGFQRHEALELVQQWTQNINDAGETLGDD